MLSEVLPLSLAPCQPGSKLLREEPLLVKWMMVASCTHPASVTSRAGMQLPPLPVQAALA